MSGFETAVLFPGQGSYDGGALALARERYPRVGEVFGEIDEVSEELFAKRVSEILFAGSGLDLAQLLAQDPWVSQLAIYGAAVAAGRVLLDGGVRPDVLVGHSLGEIAALVTAGVYSVGDGARIVAHRVRTVQELGLPAGRMVALATTEERAGRIVDLLSDELVAVAARNHDLQVVLSGPQQSLGRLLGIARLLEIGAVELKSPFPFHSPMLEPAVPALAARIAELPRADPAVPVYSPITQDYYEPGQDVPARLASHLVRPVRFAEAVRMLRAEGVHRFVEAGGAANLSALVRKVLPGGDRIRTWGTFTVDGDGNLAADGTLAALGTAPAPAGDTFGVLATALAPDTDREVFAAFWVSAGPEVVASVRTRLAEFVAAQPVDQPAPARPVAKEPAPEPVASEPEAAEPVPDRAELGAELRAQYAVALEYPEEVFTDDVRLEAELGIDSVKQVELISRAFTRYGLPERDGDLRISNYDTMSKIVDLIHGAIKEKAAAR